MPKHKFGLLSIILLGINVILGGGIFLLPGELMKLTGIASLGVIGCVASLVACIGLCFAEAAGRFNKSGGAYVYARAAFGPFIGFEVGFIKWLVGMSSWATLASGFATAFLGVWPEWETESLRLSIIVGLILFFGGINLLGLKAAKWVNNIVTISKLLPLILFVGLGLAFIQGENYIAIENTATLTADSFSIATLLVLYVFMGFEVIAVAAEEMHNPERNVPYAIMAVVCGLAVFYLLIQTVAIGVLGSDLVNTKIPIAAAARVFMGEWGYGVVVMGMLASTLGINMAASFVVPRVGAALASDGLLPRIIASPSRTGVPYIAILISMGIALIIALSGSFVTLVQVTIVVSFIQYLSTCLAVIVLRHKNPGKRSHFHLPWGYTIPLIAISVSLWILSHIHLEQLIWGIGGLLIGIPVYFWAKKGNNLRE